MDNFKYAVLGYSNFHQGKSYKKNYGDEIQSIAAVRCLPRIDAIIDRNELNRFSATDKHVLLMNGFFGPKREGADAFPPSKDIIPIYFSFHVANDEFSKNYFTSQKCLDHFKKWEPVGCRDQCTAELLGNNGINTFFSKCLTLTFDKRPTPPSKGKLFIVDGDSLLIPKSLTETNVVQRVTHLWCEPFKSHQANMRAAQHLLDRYAEEAHSVITSRLHCAIPCQAMGIPTIFLPNIDYFDYGRIGVYADVGGEMPPIKSYPIVSSNPVFRFFPRLLKQYIQRKERGLSVLMHELYKENFDWQFQSIDLEYEKKKIRHSLQVQIERQLTKL